MKSLLEAMQKFFETEGPHTYSSTQIQAPKELADKVLEFSAKIPEEDLYVEDGDYGRETDIHVTIKYGLVTDSPTAIHTALEEYGGKEIKVKLGKTSLFEAKGDTKFDVLKITVESEELVELHELLSKLENGDKHPTYKPHMTIAYLKAGLGKKYDGRTEFEGETFIAKDFWFKGKTGTDKKIDL